MTVRLIPGVGIYHHAIRADGSTDEHQSQAPIRRTPTTYVLYCAKCDSLTLVSRAVESEQRREIEEAIAKHPVLDVAEQIGPSGTPTFDHFDPLDLAREDGDKRVPVFLPLDSIARRAVVSGLT